MSSAIKMAYTVGQSTGRTRPIGILESEAIGSDSVQVVIATMIKRHAPVADQHRNFAVSTIATAPSPAASGTSLGVQSGDGTKFPTAPFYATVWPSGVNPLTTNAEIVRVTNISTDTFTITRTQESTSARTITAGDQIAQTITAATLDQFLALSGGVMTGELDILYDYPNFKVKNSSGAQYSGAGFYLLNTVSSMGNQAGVNHYMGVNDGSATQGFYTIDKTDTNGGGTGHLVLFDFNAGTVTLYPTVVLPDSTNVSVGTSTGSQIGTSSTQKLGFYGATPVVRGARVPDAVGTAASAIAAVNAVIAQLIQYGLMAP